MLSKSYELSLAKTYVSHWGMVEAVRELLQNAIDSESPFEWEFTDGSLLIHSRHSRLEPKTLLLGTSCKTDDPGSIGSFGEGYKIAMLVLTRLGYGMTIHNGRSTWKPEFRFNRKYESDMLYVVSTTASALNDGVSFEVSGLSESEIENIKDICLHMQDDIGQIKHTSKGLILMEKPGRLYVGGLFICTTELNYGYDINPKYIRLERDRQTVDSFDLKLLTKDMWFEIDDTNFIAKLMSANTPDLEYANWSTPEIVKEACYKHFRSQYKDHIIAKDQAELEQLIDKGMERVVVIGGVYREAITTSRSYKAFSSEVMPNISINQELKDFLKLNRRYMRRQAIVAFKALITASEEWKRN